MKLDFFRLAFECVQKGHTFSSVWLLRVTSPSIFILLLKQKGKLFYMNVQVFIASVEQTLLGVVMLGRKEHRFLYVYISVYCVVYE